ncbi:MAG: hypothetical protein HY319_08525 [Armatimonadetes bacterium]|nr:hypothetical protein [Armatimonadota bacterium]
MPATQTKSLLPTRAASARQRPVTAGTVHVSQGSEADLVVFDPVSPNHPWLNGRIGDEREIRRLINVAVSRGRAQAIILAPRNKLRRNFNQLIHDVKEWPCS